MDAGADLIAEKKTMRTAALEGAPAGIRVNTVHPSPVDTRMMRSLEAQFDPDDPDRVYAAVLGNIFGPNPERGVFRSDDGGASWDHVLAISDSTGAIDLVIDPNNPRILYAGMWRVERKPWTLIDGSTEGGVYKSTDGGETWQRLRGGLPGGLLGKVGVAVSPANANRSASGRGSPASISSSAPCRSCTARPSMRSIDGMIIAAPPRPAETAGP